MAVLIEGQSVVIRKEVLTSFYSGGWEAFVLAVPNETLTDDGELVRVGFDTVEEALEFVTLVATNLPEVDESEIPGIMALVDQTEGLAEDVSWLLVELIELEDPSEVVLACWLTDSQTEQVLAIPDSWEYVGSRSQIGQSYDETEFAAKYTFVRFEGGKDVYRDNETGEEIFIDKAD